jgi:predicted phosphodiesterase
MPSRRLSDAELIAAVRSGLAKGLSGNRIAAACGYAGAGPFRQRWDRLKSVYKGLPDLPDFREGIDARSRADAGGPVDTDARYMDALRRIRQLEAELKHLRASADTRQVLTDLIHECRVTPRRPPRWLVERRGSKARWHHGTPTLFLSDLHWGERVFPAQVNGVNEFDLGIAQQRLKRVTEKTITLLRDVLAKGDYDGIVVALGGDMVSGNIHDEIRETNVLPVNACVLDLLDHLCGTIDALKREFGRVYVPCVTGNHGRHDRKPRAKNAVVDNYEWVLYQFLARHYAGDDDVHIQVAESTDIVYSVQGRRYLLTHGDQFQGGTGISGPLVPWSLGDARKRSRQQQINNPYDTMIFGHWHQLAWGPGDKWIANGSLKGYDEYASRSNFGFEVPQQALWVTHPQHGITFRMGVRADD